MLMSPRNTLIDTLRIILNQIARHPHGLVKWKQKINYHGEYSIIKMEVPDISSPAFCPTPHHIFYGLNMWNQLSFVHLFALLFRKEDFLSIILSS